MKFWREEFTRKIDESQFDKQYSYNVKHAYGKVGRMQSYSAYSCMKIITDTVGPGEHHGCPFKHWDPVLLKKKMSDYGAPSEGKFNFYFTQFCFFFLSTLWRLL